MDNENFKELLNQSNAMNKVVIDLLNQKKKEHFRLWIIIIILVVVNLIEVGIFVWYENQFEEVTTSTTTTTTEDIDQNADEGNNIYQSGEKAQYSQNKEDGVTNVEAAHKANNDNKDSNQSKAKENQWK